MKKKRKKIKRVKDLILCASLALALFMLTLLPAHKIAANTFLYDRLQIMGPLFHQAGWGSPFASNGWMEEGFRQSPTEILDSTAVLKISKIHRLLSDYHTGLSSEEEEALARLIYQESLRYQYDPELIAAVILVESSFYNWSTSRKGAIGLMQILPNTGQELAQSQKLPYNSHRSLFNPDLNVKLGVQYLSYLHRRFGNLEVALTAYNYGPTRIHQKLSEGKPLPTFYTRKVLDRYEGILQDGVHDLPPSVSAEGRS